MIPDELFSLRPEARSKPTRIFLHEIIAIANQPRHRAQCCGKAGEHRHQNF
jgi:hypothetical protein